MFNLNCMITPPRPGVKPCGAEKSGLPQPEVRSVFSIPGHGFGNTARMVVPVPGVLSSSMRPW